MNDPQIWTLIAAFIGLQGVTLALLQRQLGAVESRHDAKLDALREEMRVRFEHVGTTMNAGFDHQAEVMSIRFGALEQRVAALDDDMKLVKAHLIPPAA